MMHRWVAAVVSIGLVGAVLEPLVRSPYKDGFPLSTFPMFATPLSGKVTMSFAQGVTADGRRRVLSLGHLGTGAIACAGYLLAGVAKLRLAGLSWIEGAQLGKQIAMDNLRKTLLGGSTAPLARLLVAHPDGLIVLSAGTLGLELGAPLALLGGRIARMWAWGAWGGHLGVILAMNVWFPYPLAWVAFLPLVEAEHVVEWPVRWWRSRRNRRGANPVE